MEPEHRNIKLKQLALYLRGLPPSLPILESFSHYNFWDFSPDVDWIERTGTVEGAVNRELEVRLGTRAHGPIEFVERGPAVEALVDVLDHYTKEFPNDGLLAKWIDDALAGAIHTYSRANMPVSKLVIYYLFKIINIGTTSGAALAMSYCSSQIGKLLAQNPAPNDCQSHLARQNIKENILLIHLQQRTHPLLAVAGSD
jgi:hypothetical protein